MTGTFWDTVIICALTGIVLVSTGIANPDMFADGAITKGAELTSVAFAQIPVVGTPILIFGMITFAFSTIIGWSYYAIAASHTCLAPKPFARTRSST